ncbi:S8 family peptidase [Peribacillus huizhouensis]|uniref:Type VII secretion-associated serine protease mycosin n=1 Tax=Peribacillus huizhouensis TaxID=1501239 RepID=A0ABR6CNT9_9BACI|nr:S8 family peptidase [Peribacillus huizhouensis]MBA9026703.1 type VII secretion-associated serine protease mycosin [Peribacillus huizhouensis]
MKSIYRKIAAVGLSAILLASFAAPNAFAVESNSIQSASITSIGKGKTPNEKEKQQFSEDRLIIKYTKPLTATEHRKAGATVIQQFPKLNYAVVKVKDKKNIHKVIQYYQKNSKVQLVTASVLYKSFGTVDPKVIDQYHLSMLNVDKAQSLAGKNPVTVAVIDTGIDRKHPDLKNTLLPGYNAVDPLSQPFADSHGTHVAGIIAANKDNGIGGYGIAPNVKILPIDVFDGWFATDYSIAEGILYAVEHGAKVINMSLGGPLPSPLIEEAVNKAIEKGVVIVAAAGNDGADYANYPASYEGVISVGAVDQNKKLTNYSTYGASVDVVAPGHEVYSTVYDFIKPSSFTKMSGTSMASPVVAGAAALLLSKYPNLTPTQVEYILEQTASDLGDKGYDLKYGNGLVNIVSALQFNPKNIPTFVKENWTKNEIIKSAKTVDMSKRQVIAGEITKPFEQKWIQFKVEKGDYIQTVLKGVELYDYKMMIHLYGDKNQVEKIDVNTVGAGKTEGKLVQAPFSGTVAIGVKDVNGNYSSATSKRSNYSLTVETAKTLPEDDSSIEEMIKIDSLPYQSNGRHTFTGDKEDNDYFTFEIESEKAVKINLTGIPGIKPNLSVYKVDDIFPPDEEDLLTDEEKAEMLRLILEDEEYNDPYAYSNSGAAGDAVELSFAAQPGTYILKASNKPTNYFGIIELISMLLMGQTFDQSEAIEQSLIPYQVKIDTKTLPVDEDNYPTIGDERIVNEDTPESEEIVANIRAAVQSAADPYIEEQNAFVQSQLDAAIPYKIGTSTSAFLQSNSDVDLFLVKPEQTAIIELGLKNIENKTPLIEIYQVVEDKSNKEEPMLNLVYIGDNTNWSGFTIAVKEKSYTGVKKGERYIIAVQNNYYNEISGISFEPYELTTKAIVHNPQDQYEDNDSFEHVKDLPGASFTGNFALPNDIDVFYYKATQSGIKGVSVKSKPITDAMKKAYPEELLGQYAGVVTIIEDRNNNRKLDDNEFRNATYIDKGNYGSIYGSVNLKKGHNYFILTEGYFMDMLPFSMVPYTFTFVDAITKDEDANSVVKNQTPSKPLKLIKDKKSLLRTAKGYFNAGVPNGDSDWYEHTLTKDSTGVIKLAGGQTTDGVISVYQNGKLVAQADYYGMGDEEALYLSLKKGKYYIEVKDSHGNASTDPYTLKLYMN